MCLDDLSHAQELSYDHAGSCQMEEVFCGGTTDPVKMKVGFMLEKVKALPSLFLGACHLSYHPHAYAPQNKVPWFAKVLEGGEGFSQFLRGP
jgi:hypothetical protein